MIWLIWCQSTPISNTNLETGFLILVFLFQVEQWVLEEYLHVYGVRLNPLHPFAFNDDEKSPKSKHQCEVLFKLLDV